MYKKRLDNLGRIVIPKSIRENLDINVDDFVNIKMGNNAIIVTKEIGITNDTSYQVLIKLLRSIFKIEVIIKNNVNKTIVQTNPNIENIFLDKYYKVVEKIVKDSMIIGEAILFSHNELCEKDLEVIRKIINYFANQ